MLPYPTLFLLINKLHIFKSHLLPSVCQFYKLEKISGKRKGGLLLVLYAGPKGVREAAGCCLWAGGWGGKPHQGTWLLLPPHLQLLPRNPAQPQVWGNTRAWPCDVLWARAAAGADCLDQCELLNNNFFCWAVKWCPGRAALLVTTTSRACGQQSSSSASTALSLRHMGRF